MPEFAFPSLSFESPDRSTSGPNRNNEDAKARTGSERKILQNTTPNWRILNKAPRATR